MKWEDIKQEIPKSKTANILFHKDDKKPTKIEINVKKYIRIGDLDYVFMVHCPYDPDIGKQSKTHWRVSEYTTGFSLENNCLFARMDDAIEHCTNKVLKRKEHFPKIVREMIDRYGYANTPIMTGS